MSTWQVFLATALLAGVPAAQASPVDVSGYLTSASGQAVTDSSGECWHTGEWRPGRHLASCGPGRLRPAAAAPQAAKAAPSAPEKPRIAAVTKPAPKPVPFTIS